jgi:hypothetical protein
VAIRISGLNLQSGCGEEPSRCGDVWDEWSGTSNFSCTGHPILSTHAVCRTRLNLQPRSNFRVAAERLGSTDVQQTFRICWRFVIREDAPA